MTTYKILPQFLLLLFQLLYIVLVGTTQFDSLAHLYLYICVYCFPFKGLINADKLRKCAEQGCTHTVFP